MASKCNFRESRWGWISLVYQVIRCNDCYSDTQDISGCLHKPLLITHCLETNTYRYSIAMTMCQAELSLVINSTGTVWKVSGHLEYIRNWLCSLDMNWNNTIRYFLIWEHFTFIDWTTIVTFIWNPKLL